MATYKDFVAFKLNIIKEVKKIIQENELLSEPLEELFKNKLMVIEDKVTKTKERKKRDGPSEHNLRVKAGMAYLKEKYPHVAHKIRLGTANYGSTYLKENPEAELEECIAYAINKVHEVGKFGNVYDQSPPEKTTSSGESSSSENKKTTKSKEPKEPKEPKPKKMTKKQMKEEEEKKKKMEEEEEKKKKMEEEEEKMEEEENKKIDESKKDIKDNKEETTGNDTEESFSELDSESDESDMDDE